jgi:hypothetical protein
LKLVWPSGNPPFEANLPFDLNPVEEKIVRVRGESRLARRKTEGVGEAELFDRLLEELQATELVLSYRDVRGDYSYTRYSRAERRESVEFSKKLPP